MASVLAPGFAFLSRSQFVSQICLMSSINKGASPLSVWNVVSNFATPGVDLVSTAHVMGIPCLWAISANSRIALK